MDKLIDFSGVLYAVIEALQTEAAPERFSCILHYRVWLFVSRGGFSKCQGLRLGYRSLEIYPGGNNGESPYHVKLSYQQSLTIFSPLPIKFTDMRLHRAALSRVPYLGA